MVLDINGNTLDAKFLRENGVVADYLRVVKGAVAPSIPAPPSNLVASTASTTQINLSWMDNSGNETGFRIERCTSPNCTNFTQIAEVGANVRSFSDNGLVKNTAYSYRASAFNAAGSSGFSTVANARTSNKQPRGKFRRASTLSIGDDELTPLPQSFPIFRTVVGAETKLPAKPQRGKVSRKKAS